MGCSLFSEFRLLRRLLHEYQDQTGKGYEDNEPDERPVTDFAGSSLLS
jgi:hypothetical protein